MDIHLNIYEWSALSVLIPILVGLLRWHRANTALRVMFWLSLTSLVFDLLGKLELNNHGTNLLSVHIFLVLQTLFMCLFFMYLPGLKKRYFKWLLATTVVITIGALILAFSFPLTGALNKWLMSYSTIVTILLSFLYFFDLMMNGLHIPIWKSSGFFVVSGLLMYHFANTGLFLTIDYFENDSILKLWQIKSVGYIFLNLLLTYAYFIHNKTQEDE